MSNVFFKSQFGSHIYGTNVPTSDLDFKGLMLPKFKDIILQRAPDTKNEDTNRDPNAKNTKDDVDFEIFSLHYWFELFMGGQTACYDMLFTPKQFIVQDDPIWQEIVKNKDKIVNSKISAFAGYCQGQAAKYSLKGSNLAAYRLAKDFFSKTPRVKLEYIREKIVQDLIEVAKADTKYSDKGEPLIKFVYIPHKVRGVDEEYLQVGPKTKVPMSAMTTLAADIYTQQFNKYGERAKMAESNEGVDWKALMHAVRICYEAQELLNTGNITFPRPEKDLLLQIRKGELPYAKVSDLIVGGLDDLDACKAKSTLRAEPDRKWVEDFVFNVYSSLGQL